MTELTAERATNTALRRGARVYISGPMTGLPAMNRHAFAEAEERLRDEGFDVVNPARLPDGLTWDQYLRLDLVDLLTCEGVVTLPGWQGSRGAQIEVTLAEGLGMPVVALEDAAGASLG